MAASLRTCSGGAVGAALRPGLTARFRSCIPFEGEAGIEEQSAQSVHRDRLFGLADVAVRIPDLEHQQVRSGGKALRRLDHGCGLRAAGRLVVIRARADSRGICAGWGERSANLHWQGSRAHADLRPALRHGSGHESRFRGVPESLGEMERSVRRGGGPSSGVRRMGGVTPHLWIRERSGEARRLPRSRAMNHRESDNASF